jgi:hypothetical protein
MLLPHWHPILLRSVACLQQQQPPQQQQQHENAARRVKMGQKWQFFQSKLMCLDVVAL